MKHLKIESLPAATIASIRKDRSSLSIDELMFTYNISAANISGLCEGIVRQRKKRNPHV